jgi:hypothetical protein
MLPSTVAIHSTAKTGERSGAKLLEDDEALEDIVSPQVMPGDQQESTRQAPVFEE